GNAKGCGVKNEGEMALQQCRSRRAPAGGSDRAPEPVAPPHASAPVAVGVPRNLCMALADEITIRTQCVRGKLAWIDQLRLAGGVFAGTKPVPRQPARL